MSWPLVKLGEVAPSKALKKPVVFDEDNVWQLNLDMVESGSGKVLNKIKAPLSEAGSSTHWFDSRHVLYSKLRPYLNKVVLPDEQGIATTELVPMLPDPEMLDRRYLVHYLRSKQFVSWISDQVAGAKMPRVSMKIFWEHEIPLPPLEEQKRIAAILDKADAIRQKRKQAIELTDEFLRSVFLDMFGDPVTNPKRWDLCLMRDLVDIQGGYAFKSGDFCNSGIPVVKIGNANKLGFVTTNISFIKPRSSEKFRQYELYAGDLLMSLTGTVGKDDYANITEVTSDYNMYYLNQRVAKISVKDSKMKSYLKYFFSHPKIKAELTKNNRGVRQANISNADIYNLPVSVPHDDVLQKFDKIVRQIINLRGGVAKTPLLNSLLFNSLSQKAFSGQL